MVYTSIKYRYILYVTVSQLSLLIGLAKYDARSYRQVYALVGVMPGAAGVLYTAYARLSAAVHSWGAGVVLDVAVLPAWS